MLYPLMSEQQGVLLTGLEITTAATPSISIGEGADDFATPVRASAGVFTLTPKRPSGRVLQIFGNPHEAAGALDGGGVYCSNAITERGTLSAQILGTGIIAADGTLNAIVASSLSNSTDRVMLNPVLGNKRQGGVIMLADITIGASSITVHSGGGDFSFVRTGASAATATFRRQIFGKPPIVLVQGADTNSYYGGRVANVTTAGFDLQISQPKTGAAPASARVVIMAYGFAATDSYGGGSAPISCTQRGGRLAVFQIAAGTSISHGSQLATLSGTSSQPILTMNRPFARTLYAFTSANHAAAIRMTQPDLRSSSTVTINGFNDVPGLTSADAFNVLVIGFDDPSEY